MVDNKLCYVSRLRLCTCMLVSVVVVDDRLDGETGSGDHCGEEFSDGFFIESIDLWRGKGLSRLKKAFPFVVYLLNQLVNPDLDFFASDMMVESPLPEFPCVPLPPDKKGEVSLICDPAPSVANAVPCACAATAAGPS